jgi:hypothetical protein
MDRPRWRCSHLEKQDKGENMGLLVCIAALLLAFVALFAVTFSAVVLRFRVSASASWLYLRRCLIFSLPLASGFAAFYLGLCRDPLWPDQDLTDAQYIDYQAAHTQAQLTYAIAAVLTSVALLWFIYRADTTFRQMHRLPSTTIAHLE